MLDSTAATATAIAAEDLWVAPEDWWQPGVPTRGVGPQPTTTYTTAADAWATAVDAQRDAVLDVLERTAATGGTDLADAGRTALTDPAGCSPLGAAVLAAAVNMGDRHSSENPLIAAEAWMREHGAGFAAEAAVQLSGSRVEHRYTQAGRIHEWFLVRCTPDDFEHALGMRYVLALRPWIAALAEDAYRDVVERLGQVRITSGGLGIRIAASYLAPTERDWVAADLRDVTPTANYHTPVVLLLAAAGSATEMEAAARALTGPQLSYGHGRTMLYTALARFGPEGAGVLAQVLDRREVDGAATAELADMLSLLPSDAAFSALLARVDRRYFPKALAAAAHRFPLRAMRLLRPAAERSATARHMVRSVIRSHPELTALHPELAAATPRVAAPEELPEVLRIRPWQQARRRAKPVVLADVAAARPTRVAWADGERAEWAETHVYQWPSATARWPRLIAEMLAAPQRDYNSPSIFALGPEELVRPHLATVRPGRLWGAGGYLRRVLARFEEEGADFVLAGAQANPATLADLLLPVTGTEVTRLMTRWLDGRKVRPTALAWFDRHLGTALPDVIAAALAKPGTERRLAESALRVLAERGHRAAIETAAAALSQPVADAVAGILAADPLFQLPARIPELPNWLVLDLLPPLLLRDGDAALPLTAAGDVCVMLAMCGPNGDYAGAAEIIEAADPDSLAEFTWGIFEEWKLADYPAKDGWVLHALGLTGNDLTARQLAPLIRSWPGESGHSRAVTGLDVLAAIGSDTALMQLHGIAEKVKFKGLKTKAQEKIGEVADGLGLTHDELADRLVPDFGLDERVDLVLDYGPRGFVIGFDEELKPVVFDAERRDGDWTATARRKWLPKPGAKDDPESAAAAYKSFTVLKKDVKSAAADQLRRLEQAMVRGRHWPGAAYRQLFVEHQLLWHLARHLVWATFDENGSPTGSFRLAEDRSYADAADDPVTVADDAMVGIAHPLHLTGSLGAWGEIFAYYEILQPFPQLQREIHTLTETELRSSTLARFSDRTVPTGKVLGLTRFGWERGEVLDGGVSGEMFRTLGNGHSIVIELEPGLIAGYAMEWDEQRIQVHLSESGHESSWPRTDTAPAFADLSPIVASELLRELTTLTA
ncbi:DUF4132 domain-containing protein [Nocardia crassostreae]|uniref:DUF4132 domain-containing protein n=1 Tax=Nocardia crassostreae TaxID=53428 RepID=UPI00082C3298|nr:DUF4132 domain-containing protein [Nocardia crassostreae]